MKPFLSLLVLVLTLPSVLAGPAEAVAAALFDARKLPPGVRENTRYLSLYAVDPADRNDWRHVIAFHANQLSRELDIVRPRQVTPDLLAVNLLDYQWSAKTWDKFADADLYFTQRISKFWPGGVWTDGYHYPPGNYFVFQAAPWLPANAMAELSLLTGSRAPLLRADWWFYQTAIQEGRKVGYYDMLGLSKKLSDFEALAGLDRKLAAKLRKETAAIVSTSVVALHNRQIFRFQTLTGAFWETRDTKNNLNQRNALRFLNGDFQYDAGEYYATLPNGLFAYFLADSAGNRANTAPDDIASDGRAHTPDRRVHVGLSCVRCHEPGIQPVDDWGRRAYAAPDFLSILGDEKYRRLKSLYLSDLDRHIRRDQSDYADALKLVNGLTPGDNAKLFAWAWDQYDGMVTLDVAAREYGVAREKVVAAFREIGTVPRTIDPVLFSLGKGIPVQRQAFEELFGVGMEIIRRSR